MTSSEACELSTGMLRDWQSIVDLIVKLSGVRVGLIMKVTGDHIAVMVSSNTENNPYHVGDQEHLKHSGLYCEAVIRSGQPLLVPDALKDPAWDKNPDLKFGLLSYLGFPIRLPDGNILGTLCVLDDKENHYTADIVELMSRMRELIESQMRLEDENRQFRIFAKESVLRRMLDSVPVAIACASIHGQQSRTLYLNRQFSRMLGLTATSDASFLSWPKLRISRSGQDATEELQLSDIVARTLQNPETTVVEEMRVHRDDGARVDAVFSGVLIEDLLLITLVDITEQKAGEEELLERQARLNLVLAASGLGVWDWDLTQNSAIFDARALAIVGCETDELQNIDAWQAGIHPDDLAMVRSRLKDHLDGNATSYEVEYRRRHQDGHWVWILSRGKIVARSPAGLPLRLTGTHQDISQRKQLESESRSLLQQITTLIQHAIKPQNDAPVLPEAAGEKRFNRLTRRQKEILRLVATGLTSADIAGHLSISVDTVETHRRDLARKLDVRSVAALTKVAIENGLV